MILTLGPCFKKKLACDLVGCSYSAFPVQRITGIMYVDQEKKNSCQWCGKPAKWLVFPH